MLPEHAPVELPAAAAEVAAARRRIKHAHTHVLGGVMSSLLERDNRGNPKYEFKTVLSTYKMQL